jgi:PKD repeat protein
VSLPEITSARPAPLGALTRTLIGIACLVVSLGLAPGAAAAAPSPPTVSFVYTPPSPFTGETTTFTSTSTPGANNTIVDQRWDLDGDHQFDDASGSIVAFSFATAGPHEVGLQVLDKREQTFSASQTVVVRTRPPPGPKNQPPFASFAYYPGTPSPGETINFFSTSTDPDSPIAVQAWDLDGDRQFDDATGPSATRSFPRAGIYNVSLLVQDTSGATATTTKTIAVGAGSAAGQPVGSLGVRSFRLLTPFPIVRLSATITRLGLRIDRVTVEAPRRTRIKVRCHGRGCPFSRYSVVNVKGTNPRVTRHGAPGARMARALRVRLLEGRLLRAGVRLELFITKPHMIGKYTRFRIRRSRPPRRVDRCLLPGASRPVRCPAS